MGASPSWQELPVTWQCGRRPGGRDLQLLKASVRRCHAQAAPLMASSTAGCSVGSLRVAGAN